MVFWAKIKKKIWHSFYKLSMKTQKALLEYGILKYKRRQEYHIGWLAPDKTLEDLRMYLHSEWGFGNHFIAWIDPGQVLSWRKLKDANTQYHIRVFYDGEIRGHLEGTPESSFFKHLFKKGAKEAQLQFLKFLGEYVVYEQTISQIIIDPKAYNPNAEMVEESTLN